MPNPRPPKSLDSAPVVSEVAFPQNRAPAPMVQPPHPHPVVQGCAITSIGMLTLAALPFFGIAWLIYALFNSGTAFGPGMSPNFLVVSLIPVLFFLTVIYKIVSIARARPKPIRMAPWNGTSNPPQIQITSADQRVKEKQERLFASLNPENRSRHHQLCAKITRVQTLVQDVDDPETRAQFRPGLEKLQWLHLKGLLAHEHLTSLTPTDLHGTLQTRLAALQQTLDSSPTPAARKSTESTIALTEERLRSVVTRRNRLAEIACDLERIEAQLDHSLERAALHSSAPNGNFQLDLAERMVETSELFGSSLPLVSELDAYFQAPASE